MTLNQPSNKPLPFDRAIAVKTFLRPLVQYLATPQVTEIAIVRPGELFTRERDTWVRHECGALALSHLQALANGLATYNNIALAPLMPVDLPDGERGQIVMPPACVDGTIILNIRKHTVTVMSLQELATMGAFDDVQDSAAEYAKGGISEIDTTLVELKNARRFVEFLDVAVQTRKNIVIGGKTGSGKTTFARSLIERVPFDERLITIEDNHELLLPNHPNRVHLIYGRNRGRTTPTECLEACMRLSPDRIFLAELRGPETWDYLAALNTGHPGSVTTTHANSAHDTFDRLAILIKQSRAGGQIDLATIQAYLRQTVDIVLFYDKYQLKQIWFDPKSRSLN